MKAVIIENEQPDLERITSLLAKNFSSIYLAGTADNVPQGIELVNKIKPDLLFLDVELPPYSGFDLLKRIEEPGFEVVFTTAYDKYALQAIKSCALDFLLKPYTEEDFVETLKRFEQRKIQNKTSQQLELLINNLSTDNHISKVALPTANGLLFVEVRNIVHCQSDNSYTTFFTKDNKSIVVSKSIKECEDILLPHNFFRIHNSHLINLNEIKEYHRGAGGSVIMSDNSELQVSRFKKDEFLSRIEKI